MQTPDERKHPDISGLFTRTPSSVMNALRSRPSHARISDRFDWHGPQSRLQWIALGASLIALIVSLLNFTLLVGALPMPVPGLRASGITIPKDTSTYGFEYDNNGWLPRGAASSAVANDIHVYAGQGALEFQVAALTSKQQAFVYTTVPPLAKAGVKVVAHLYAPAGAPPLLATIYGLDDKFGWNSGPYIALNPGVWTAVIWQIPAQTHLPIRELGIMILGIDGTAPYTGPIYLDSVDLQRP